MSDEKKDPEIDIRNPAALVAFLRGDIPNAIAASTPGGIKEQEARGQKAFNNSDVLPIQMQGITKEELETLGFLFGPVVDELFQQAMLPEGWTKRPAPDHDMWSYLYDPAGTKRASVFYKAAFYDRKAFLSWQKS